MLRKFWIFSGVFCLLCAVAPLFYGIVNIGTVVLVAMGGFFCLLPRLWRSLAPRPRLRRFVGALTGMGLASFALLSALMVWRAYLSPPPLQGPATVIVLGAKVNGTQPSLMLKRRLDEAADYLGSNPAAVCIVTGGQGADEDYPEAQVMAWYLEAQGIEGDRIHIEDLSTNTRENFRYAAAYLKEGQPVIIATDGFHQLRSYLLARDELSSQSPQRYYALPSYTPPGLLPMYWVRDLCGVPLVWLSTAFF